MAETVFKRYEIKYLITQEQKSALLEAMAPYMLPDRYGRSTIRNIYFDTDSYRLIRRSLEKPIYKEKLRLRSYCLAERDTPIFVELKKKYRSVVYKRRLSLPQSAVMGAFRSGDPLPVKSQIGEEIEYFRHYYEGLSPRVFLSYEREAFFSQKGDLRITFDSDILYRTYDLSLTSPPCGEPLLSEGQVLMEVKTGGAIPLWLCEVLTKHRIFKASFSKYGRAYTQMLAKKEINI